LSALPPPLYPTALLLIGLVIVLALRAQAALAAGRRPYVALAAAGALGGPGLGTHLRAGSGVAGGAVWVRLRAGGARRTLLAALLPLLLLSAPWWTSALQGRDARRIVRVTAREESLGAHLREVVPQMHVPLLGLLGTHAPLVADDPEGTVVMP